MKVIVDKHIGKNRTPKRKPWEYDIVEFCPRNKNDSVIKKVEDLGFNETELLYLWMFDNHVVRLLKFAKPLREKRTLTELRLSAILNEIRPFMLKGDPIHFFDIRNIISQHSRADGILNERLKDYKNDWKKYDINKKHASAKKMNSSYRVDAVVINTYADLLGIFIYGKYIHNDKDLKNTAVAHRMETGVCYPNIRAGLIEGIIEICDILNRFDKDFVKPIVDTYRGTIKYRNWRNINDDCADESPIDLVT